MKIPDSDMVDMKYSKDERAEEAAGSCSSPDGTNMPDYPCGLTISLDDVSLKKLGITELPEVGDEYHLIAVAKVTSLSSSASEKSEENRMTLQICYLQAVHEDEEPGEKETAAYENAENKSGVKSLLTNAMG